MTARLKPTLIVLVAACHGAPVEPCPSPRVAGIAAEQGAPVARPSPFDSVFQAAGTEFDVSPALLKAIGWVETRWQMVEGREEFSGRPPRRPAEIGTRPRHGSAGSIFPRVAWPSRVPSRRREVELGRPPPRRG